MKTIVITAAGLLLPAVSYVKAANIEVDPTRSRIQVDVKATGHQFTGDLRKYTLTASGERATGKPSDLHLAWDFNDLKTGEAKRDKEMIKWLGGGNPKGSFAFQKSWEETAAGGKAQGTLTIHGVSKTVAFPYTVKSEDGWVAIDGSVSMDYQDFKLPIIRTMAVMTVDPELNVRFHVVGKLK